MPGIQRVPSLACPTCRMGSRVMPQRAAKTFLRLACVVLFALVPAFSLAQDPAIPDAALAARLEEVHQRGLKITALRARFEQRKKTPLLKKPVVTSGLVRVRSDRVLWETLTPRPASLLMADGKIRIYFPGEKTVEVYELEDRLAQLASSPLPQLPILKQFFVIREAPHAQTAPADAPADPSTLMLELTPIDPSLAKHLKQVVVTLDTRHATLNRLQIFDADGGWSSVEFSETVVNPPLQASDVELKLPPDVRESYPLGRKSGGRE